ncbi:Transcription initiation factor TFIIE beta subunit [Euphorbia peplus]|nr:Transcription initiation factor TFIIE beta subunit [Euphorbia peplus]
MALQDQLNKFQKQQEKCQTTLSSIAKSRPVISKTPQKPIPVAAPPFTSTKTPGPQGKFSKETERYQAINNIRKGATGKQIKLVIDLLLRTREALTPEQINAECFVEVNNNKAVFDSLTNNPKVSYDGRCFAYKSKHNLKNKKDLLDLVKKYPQGIAVIDLKDSYPTVLDDLQALKRAGQIWLLSNFDSQEDIAYPNDQRVAIKVDDELKQLFRGVELPRDMLDIEKDLQKNGMRPATNTAKRRADAQVHGISTKPKSKKKNKEISKRTKLTNQHLPHLFEHLNN